MSNKSNIPSWQRASADADSATPSGSEPQSAEPQPQTTSPIAEAPTPTEDDLDTTESANLLDQAKRFLEDATIRDAPREKKVAFLESKGVGAEDIETLLGEDNAQIQDSPEIGEAGQRAWSTVSANNPCISLSWSPNACSHEGI